MIVNFDLKERELIQKIIAIQLESISEMIAGDMETDLEMFCIFEDLDKKELLEKMHEGILEFRQVSEFPETLLFLNKSRLSVFKHIMFQFFDQKRYDEQRRNIYRKIDLWENLLFKYN